MGEEVTSRTNASALEAATRTSSIRELRGALFRLPLPAGWTDRSIYCAFGPAVDGQGPTLTVTVEQVPEGNDITVLAQDHLRQQSGQLDEYRLLSSEKRFLDTKTCHCAKFQWKTRDGRPVRQVQWFVHKEPNLFVITATSGCEAAPEVENQLEAIARGFVAQDGRA